MENLNIIDINSVIIENPETSCKFSKTIRWAKKTSKVVGADKSSTRYLYSKTTKISLMKQALQKLKNLRNNFTLIEVMRVLITLKL